MEISVMNILILVNLMIEFYMLLLVMYSYSIPIQFRIETINFQDYDIFKHKKEIVYSCEKSRLKIKENKDKIFIIEYK